MEGKTRRKRPVVLVHGIFSDILKHENRVVWPCKTPFHLYELKSNALNFLAGRTNPSTLEYESFTGVNIQAESGLKAVDRLVKTSVLWKLGVNIVDCFDVLIAALVAIGYKEDEDLVAYTYDFRQSPLIEKQQTEFKDFLLRFRDNTPIIIAHSMGTQIVKLFMHANKDWERYFRHFIAVSGAFDGSTATEMILTLVGYDLGVKLLGNCTRFLWANSGMSMTLTPGSELIGAVPCIFLRVSDEADDDERFKSEYDDPELWREVKILKENKGYIMAILKQIKASPELVRYKVRYWIKRFKLFLGRDIEIPELAYEEPEPYVEHRGISLCPEEFLKVDYTLQRPFTGDYHIVQVTEWGPDSNGFTPAPRVEEEPERVEYAENYFAEDIDADKMALKVAQSMMRDVELPSDLPFIAERKMSLFDFYDNIYPKYSLERFLFGSIKPLFELQARTRLEPIERTEELRYACFAGANLPTPMFVHFSPVKHLADLRFVMPEIVFGQGDGSILLVSQLSDGFQAEKRRIYAGVEHHKMIRERHVVQDIIATVCEFE